MAPVTRPAVTVIDYHSSPEASNLVLPKPAIRQITCKDWHFETQRQPAHDTGEHCHSMNLITMVTSKTPINQSIDGQMQRNLVGLPHHKLNHVLDYIRANLNNSLGLEELAQQPPYYRC